LKAGTDASDDALELKPWNALLRAAKSLTAELGNRMLTEWREPVDGMHERCIDPNAIEDILVVCHYSL
jgi:hypothetical protein